MGLIILNIALKQGFFAMLRTVSMPFGHRAPLLRATFALKCSRALRGSLHHLPVICPALTGFNSLVCVVLCSSVWYIVIGWQMHTECTDFHWMIPLRKIHVLFCPCILCILCVIKCSNIPKTLEKTIVINCLRYPLLSSCWKWLNPKNYLLYLKIC